MPPDLHITVESGQRSLLAASLHRLRQLMHNGGLEARFETDEKSVQAWCHVESRAETDTMDRISLRMESFGRVTVSEDSGTAADNEQDDTLEMDFRS